MESTRKPLNEDRVALLLGAVIFILAMLQFNNMDILGWAVKTGMWVGDPLAAWSSATKGYLPGVSALVATYVFLAAALAVGVKLMGANVKKFLSSFTIIFFIAIACYTLGANAHIAANETQWAKYGITWGMGLSTEAGLIIALVVGILISNFAPGLADSLKDACRPELFVKIAIVIMGAELGVKAAGAPVSPGTSFSGDCAPSSKPISCTGASCTTLPESTSNSTVNGPLRWRPASPSAACPPPSPPAAPSDPGPWFRSWCPRWSSCSPALKC